MNTEINYKVQTRHPEGKIGISIDREIYSIVSNYIFQSLKKNEASTLASLIDKAKEYFPSRFNNWTLASYLFWIKLDLEARGIIKGVYPKHGKGTQSFKLTRKWLHKNPSTLLDQFAC
jgi:hypothetical protein